MMQRYEVTRGQLRIDSRLTDGQKQTIRKNWGARKVLPITIRHVDDGSGDVIATTQDQRQPDRGGDIRIRPDGTIVE